MGFIGLDVGAGVGVPEAEGAVLAAAQAVFAVVVEANGEHRALTYVYYIPQLRTSIVSLGQLDEHGCKSVIQGGVLCVG